MRRTLQELHLSPGLDGENLLASSGIDGVFTLLRLFSSFLVALCGGVYSEEAAAFRGRCCKSSKSPHIRNRLASRSLQLSDFEVPCLMLGVDRGDGELS